jgi:FG-GAP-like repeat
MENEGNPWPQYNPATDVSSVSMMRNLGVMPVSVRTTRARCDGDLPMRALLACLAVGFLPNPCSPQALERLKYNHPGLVVDLGVGLWAWPIPCDADGDGDFDLIVSCPDKPSNGVWFFENTTGDTAKNKLSVFKPARKLSSTVHYVMPSYVDVKLRVLSPGFEYSGFEKTGIEKRVALPVAAKFYVPEGKQPKGPKVRHNQWRYVDYDGDGALDLIVGVEDWSYYGWDDAWNARGEWTNGPLRGFVILFRNTGTTDKPKYAEPSKIFAGGKPIDVFGCPSPNFADFDGDGDLDLLCGEFLDGFTYFENVGTRTQPRYAKGRRVRDLNMDLQMIVPIAFDWDKDGDLDLIVGDEDGRVAFIENTGKLAADRTPIFAQPIYFKQEADSLKCGALATPVGVDWDGDGDIDIVSGNTAGYIEFFENLSGPRVEQPKWAAPRRLEVDGKPFRIMAGPNGSIQGPAEAKWGYTTFSVADWDGDGLPDIVLNSILGDVVWLRNVGTRTKPKLAAPQPVEVEWQTPQPTLAWGWRKPTGKALLTQWRTTPVVFDFNGDGLADLAMLDQEGYLAFFERAKRDGKLVVLHPRRAFVDEKGAPLRLNARTAGASGRRKLCLTDWDGDGKFDFLLNSVNADFLQQIGAKDGTWIFKQAGTLAKQNIEGHDVSPTVVDFNGDGIPDFLGGAEDGRIYYLANPKTKSK